MAPVAAATHRQPATLQLAVRVRSPSVCPPICLPARHDLAAHIAAGCSCGPSCNSNFVQYKAFWTCPNTATCGPSDGACTCNLGYYSAACTGLRCLSGATAVNPTAACPNQSVYCAAASELPVAAGYYATGCNGDGTACTGSRPCLRSGRVSRLAGQAMCSGVQYYCSGGVQYAVASAYFSTPTTASPQLRTGQSICPVGAACAKKA